ncbi:MAG: excisionase family DNA-binding protein [Candidatus Acidiferrales bacterium]
MPARLRLAFLRKKISLGQRDYRLKLARRLSSSKMQEEKMLSLEIKLFMKGKELSIDSVAQAIAEQLRHSVHDEITRTLSKPENPNQQSALVTGESPRQVVSVREAARLLSLSQRTINTYIALKKIRVVRVGRRVLVPMTSVNAIASKGISASAPTHVSERTT